MKKLALTFLAPLTVFCVLQIESIAIRILFSFVIFFWFLFLDDFSREKMFDSNWINWPLGHLASMICLLPFFQWKTIQEHPEYHKAIERKWILPFNVVAYSVKNFWNIKRLWKAFPEKRKKFLISIFAMNLMFMVIIPQVPKFWIKFGPSYAGFLLLAEIYLQNINRRIRLSLNLGQE